MHIRKVNDSAVRKHKEGMMNTAVIGFPRVGKLRELKFASEKFFHQEISEEELLAVAAELRKEHWGFEKEAGIHYISSNDFSFYDGMLDTAVMLGAVPQSYRGLGLSDLCHLFCDGKRLSGRPWGCQGISDEKMVQHELSLYGAAAF